MHYEKYTVKMMDLPHRLAWHRYDRNGRRHPRKVLHKLKLRTRLWATRKPFTLLDHLPLFRDELQRVRPVPRDATLDEPTPDDEARPPDPATTVYGADPPAALAVPEHVEDAAHKVDALGQAPIGDRKIVVLDLLGVDPEQVAPRGEVRVVGKQLVRLGEVDKGPHAGLEERVEFLLRLFARDVGGREWAVGELAGDEVRGGPVGVWDGA